MTFRDVLAIALLGVIAASSSVSAWVAWKDRNDRIYAASPDGLREARSRALDDELSYQRALRAARERVGITPR